MTAPLLVVRLGDAMFSFPPGKVVVVGRGEQSDIRVESEARQAISRIHLVLRVENGQWTAIAKSRNGIYVDGIRVQTVPVDGNLLPIALGAATGRKLIFRTATRWRSSKVTRVADHLCSRRIASITDTMSAGVAVG